MTMHANYSAANTFLEGLAAIAAPAVSPLRSIAWGPWRGVGFAVAGGNRLAEFGLHGLRRKRRSGSPWPAAAPEPALCRGFDADWRAFAAAFRDAAAWPIFSEVMAEAMPHARGARARRRFATKPRRWRRGPRGLRSWRTASAEIVAAVVRRGASQLDRDKPFRALGVDSLMGLELRNRLAAAFAVAFPATLIWNFPTVRALAPELARRAGLARRERSRRRGRRRTRRTRAHAHRARGHVRRRRARQGRRARVPGERPVGADRRTVAGEARAPGEAPRRRSSAFRRRADRRDRARHAPAGRRLHRGRAVVAAAGAPRHRGGGACRALGRGRLLRSDPVPIRHVHEPLGVVARAARRVRRRLLRHRAARGGAHGSRSSGCCSRWRSRRWRMRD